MVLPTNVLSLLFYFYVMAIILSHIIEAEKITADIIFGAINVYFLVGLAWSVIYSIIYILEPQAYYVAPSLIVNKMADLFIL